MREVAVIITKNSSIDAELYFYPDISSAISKLKKFYLQEIKNAVSYDYHNTYITEDGLYAQVSFGIEQLEFRICEIDRHFPAKISA